MDAAESVQASEFIPPSPEAAGLLDPERAVPLKRGDLDGVPQGPGLYAIWILDNAALRACGIDGPAPKLLYVGKAQPLRGGLRRRMYRHIAGEWVDLFELLAVRGHVLFPWWIKHWPRASVHYIGPTTPLAELCQRQALDWQNKVLRYTWTELDLAGKGLSQVEASIIRTQAPMLNRQLLPRFRPPQLRSGSRYQRARARWLWHTSWAAVILPGMSEEWWDAWRPEQDDRFSSDPLGYPASRAEAARTWDDGTIDWLSFEEISELMVHCARHAPQAVREAVATTTDIEELELWWAAHAAAPILGASVEDALAASLNGASEHEYPGPASLPVAERMVQLLAVSDRSFMRTYH